MEGLVELLDKIPLEALIAVWGFAIIVNRLVAGFITPIFEKKKWDRFWIMYVSWAVAVVFILTTEANIFPAYIPNVWVGRIATALVVGGVANLQHDKNKKANLLIGLSGLGEDAEVEIEQGE